MFRGIGLDRLKSYRQAGGTARLAVGSAALGLIVLAAALLSLSLGPVEIPVSHVAAIIFSPLGLDLAEFGRTEELVIQQIRLPRIVVGACVGMALGVAGATMQGLFRNPMADPGIIGVSAGGAVGAVVAIAIGAAGVFFLALPAFAFVGAMVACFLVYGIAAVGGRFSMATLLLAGGGGQRISGGSGNHHYHPTARQRSSARDPFLACGWPGLPNLGARTGIRSIHPWWYWCNSTYDQGPEFANAGG